MTTTKGILPTLTKETIGGLHLLAVEEEATKVEEAEATEAVEAVAEVEAAVEVDEEVVVVAEEGVEGMVFCLIPTIPTGTTPRLSGPSSPMSKGSKLEQLGSDTMKPEEGLLLQLALAATTAAIIMATMATTMEMLLRLQPRLQPRLLPSSRSHHSQQQPQ